MVGGNSHQKAMGRAAKNHTDKESTQTVRPVAKHPNIRTHLHSAMSRAFAKFTWRRDVIWPGLGITFLTVLGQMWFHLSAFEDWKKNPFGLVVSSILAIVGVVLVDVMVRILWGLFILYRERSHKEFRDPINSVLVILLGNLAFFVFIFTYVPYKTSPHLRLVQGPFCIGNFRQASEQPTALFALLLRVTNTGIATTISLDNWSMEAKLQDGEVVEGTFYLQLAGHLNLRPWTDNTRISSSITIDDLIAPKTSVFAVDKYNSAEGYVVFVFPKVRLETLLNPGTEFTVSCIDKTGKKSTVTFYSKAEETTTL